MVTHLRIILVLRLLNFNNLPIHSHCLHCWLLLVLCSNWGIHVGDPIIPLWKKVQVHCSSILEMANIYANAWQCKSLNHIFKNECCKLKDCLLNWQAINLSLICLLIFKKDTQFRVLPKLTVTWRGLPFSKGWLRPGKYQTIHKLIFVKKRCMMLILCYNFTKI